MSDTRVVAIGLLTRADLERLGNTFSSMIPVDGDDAIFEDLLRQLDQIEVEQFGKGIVIRPDIKA